MSMTYADVWRPTSQQSGRLYDVALILLSSLTIALSAQLALELPGGVPITGQTFGVLLVGALLGSRRGAAALLAYLAQGALGLPVFANGGAGFATLIGIKGGYLFGFVIAAAVVGKLAERGWDRRISTTIGSMLIGNITIYAIGVPWLKTFAPDWSTALQWGLLPFLVGDALKIALAAALLPLGWKLLGKRSHH